MRSSSEQASLSISASKPMASAPCASRCRIAASELRMPTSNASSDDSSVWRLSPDILPERGWACGWFGGWLKHTAAISKFTANPLRVRCSRSFCRAAPIQRWRLRMTRGDEDALALRRVPTGITGLDEILYGGFLEGGVYIVQGSPGAGKTVL